MAVHAVKMYRYSSTHFVGISLYFTEHYDEICTNTNLFLVFNNIIVYDLTFISIAATT